ncbi:hypothetical protein Rhe02_05960 [Rhizocola hellebori]|uniref:Spore coat protein U domain-containing protein n=1 Tax=Rhizocola hellebori TaxID=1392758 RepID=A0A8J3VCG5_9ACTN|nr:hypothetical protein [Rhizocola hellebori]GIH02529.1 hypothetical protein Rhe02_05960 [Rhizocola hellebori]
MSVRLTTRLAAVLLMIAGVFAVPSTASAATFVCGSSDINGSFLFRACIDDTDQGQMWYELQITNRSTISRSVTWNISYFTQSILFSCSGTRTTSIGAQQTAKYYCVGVKYIGRTYMNVSKVTVGSTTVHVASPTLYF